MTEREADERRAWWAIQSEKRALARRIEEGSISFAHAAEVEEQIRVATELYRDALQRTIAEARARVSPYASDGVVARVAELEARLEAATRWAARDAESGR